MFHQHDRRQIQATDRLHKGGPPGWHDLFRDRMLKLAEEKQQRRQNVTGLLRRALGQPGNDGASKAKHSTARTPAGRTQQRQTAAGAPAPAARPQAPQAAASPGPVRLPVPSVAATPLPSTGALRRLRSTTLFNAATPGPPLGGGKLHL